jgi:hypothetical protein
MLRKISSIKDIQQLVIGDTLLDHAELEKAKAYTVRNITNGIIYAIHDDGYCDLKVFPADSPSERDWWLLD